MLDFQDRVRAALAEIERRDQRLAKELQAKRQDSEAQASARSLAPMLESFQESTEPVRPEFALETIVLRTGRPVLAVKKDEAQLVFTDADSEVWRERLKTAHDQLTPAIRAVGRIELENHPRLEWVGTGWLVRPEILVTNRHVANEFSRMEGNSFVFRTGLRGKTMGANVDFVEEFGRLDSSTFRLREVLHIEPESGPDVAFLAVEPLSGKALAHHIDLSDRAAQELQMVAAIGYPARDSRIPDQALMESIFGNVFDKKRLAPGQIIAGGSTTIEHDCSTLGGNSGSVLLDLKTGKALGIHFAGRFLEANFAVPATLIQDSLGRIGRAAKRPEAPRSSDGNAGASGSIRLQKRPPEVTTAMGDDSRGVTFIVPLRVTVDIGSPTREPQHPAPAQQPLSRPTPPKPAAVDDTSDEVVLTEAVPEDLAGRQGFDREFLGFNVPLPKVVRDTSQILKFQSNGRQEQELRYRNFSVVMNRDRRLCFFSAVNVDGSRPQKIKRGAWRTDPRIPANAQIIHECYGNEPKFSRGHMTRREDPMWGNLEDAAQGNLDSMHVTNVVPQMQPFNAGIWLGLEEFALENARQDDMRICVFTGPFLLDSDPEKFGVRIPVSFWKVIAFIHDETGDLTATGYTMSQQDFLREEEFVFGQHETAQISIRSIEQQTGLSFGNLSSLDPLRDTDESIAGPLTSFRQIRFR
jgi:endonuclease G